MMALFALAVSAGTIWSATATAEEAVAGEFSRLVEIMEGNSHPVKGLAAAHEVGELRPYLVPADYVARLNETSKRVDHPLVEFVIRRQAARADLERGEGQLYADDTAFAREHSCLVDWSVVGPFDNPSMQGFEDPLGPERGDPGPYQGRFSEIDWRELGSGHHLCAYRLGRWVEPSSSSVAYLSTVVEVEEAKESMLLVGSRSAYRMWVNGKPLGERATEHGLGLDAEGWKVALEAGENEILVKLGSSGSGAMSWVARLVDEEGRPLRDWSAAGRGAVAELERFEDVEGAHGGAKKIVEDGADRSQDASTRLAAATLWSRLYSDDGSQPWRDVAEDLARDSRQLSPREMLWLAELYDEHWRRQVVLDEALSVADGDPLVRWRRAVERGETLSELEAERKRRELEAIREQSPQFLLALETLAQWYDSRGDSSRALQVMESYEDEERRDRPNWVRNAARLHERVGDRRQAVELRHRAADLHQLTGLYGFTLLRETMAGGDQERAFELVKRYQERAPWSQQWFLHEARLHRVAGDLQAALAVVEEQIERTPGDAELRQRRAELLMLAGDREDAMASVEEAISLRPQVTRYQEFLEFLQPEPSRFYEPWVVTEVQNLADEFEEGTQDYDILVDQVIHQVASNGLASQFEQRVVRVLRDEGVGRSGQMRISYRPGDERVEVLGVRVHKADGTISEDYDQWQQSRTRQSARMYNDRAYINVRANDVDVGDLVEFRYIKHEVANENFRGDYFGDTRYIQRTRPVGFSRYVAHYPKDWEIFFRPPRHEHERMDDELPNGEAPKGQRVTAFEMRNIPRVHTESDQPGNADVYDYILASNKRTYDEVATWWWELIEEQLVVDDAIRETVAELVEGLEEDSQKLEAIYEYVVRNTRYLHLGLGIHGWKPYRTSTVFRNRYGDCKDKAALLKVMLEEAGIDAEMVLVRTRRLGEVEDKPANMHVFNHAVTYVPSMDLFMDPTARFNGPYELTQMDQGAQALIVRDGGEGRWVTMPVDEAQDNLVREVLEVDLRDGVPLMTATVEAHGDHAVRDRRRFEDPERRDELFEDRLRRRFAGLELLEAEYEDLDGLTVPTTIRFRAEVPDAKRGGQGSASVYPYVAQPELLDSMARQATRHQDLTFRVPFAREAEVRYLLPEEMAVERMPSDRSIESPFGEMSVNYEHEGEELVVHIRYSIEVQRVAREDYPEFRRFVAEMDAALDETIRLVGVGE